MSTELRERLGGCQGSLGHWKWRERCRIDVWHRLGSIGDAVGHKALMFAEIAEYHVLSARIGVVNLIEAENRDWPAA